MDRSVVESPILLSVVVVVVEGVVSIHAGMTRAETAVAQRRVMRTWRDDGRIVCGLSSSGLVGRKNLKGGINLAD